MLLMQAQENGMVLDKHQLLFIAGGETNMFDDDVDEALVQDLALYEDHVFHADQCDAFDSDVDEAPTAQTMFMANLSSANPIYDEIGSAGVTRSVPAEVTRSVPAGVTRSVPAGITRSVPTGVTRSVPAEFTRSVPTGVTRSVPAGVTRLVPAGITRSVPAEFTRSVPSNLLDRLSTKFSKNTNPTNLTSNLSTHTYIQG
nr:integrase, catalytic region, zinc finger, CCHC-type, peptidase aspartic, catalytic [Tanacetum cinerariifolium]